MFFDTYKNDSSVSTVSALNFELNVPDDEFISVLEHFQHFNGEDLDALNLLLNEICTTIQRSKGDIINFPGVNKTQMMDHLILLISEKNFPPAIKAKSIFILGWFLNKFTEEQINYLITQPFIPGIFSLLKEYLSIEESHGFQNELSFIFFFLSKLAKTTIDARDTIIWNFPLPENENEYEDLESKMTDFFRYLIDYINYSSDENCLKSSILFLKSLCHFKLNENSSSFICYQSRTFFNKSDIYWANLLKIDLQFCANGFVHETGDVILRHHKLGNAIRKGNVKTLKCASNIIQFLLDNEMNLDEDESLLQNLSNRVEETVVETEESVIILNTIEKIIGNESEMSDIYLRQFLRQKLIQKVNYLIRYESLSSIQKVSALKLLQIFSNKQEEFITKELIKEKCISFVGELFNLDDLYLNHIILQFMLNVITSSQNNAGMLMNILQQFNEIDIDSQIANLIHTENEELPDLAQQIQQKIDEIRANEENLDDIDDFMDSSSSDVHSVHTPDDEGIDDEGMIVNTVVNLAQPTFEEDQTDIDEQNDTYNEEEDSDDSIDEMPKFSMKKR